MAKQGRTSNKVLIASIIVLACVIFANKPNPILFLAFFSGIIASILKHKYDLENLFSKPQFGILIICLLYSIVNIFNSGNDIIPILISTIIFIMIIYNNSIFGILHWPISRKLGQITYSMYLIHGIILYVVFNFLIGIDAVKKMSIFEHWTIIASCIFPLVLICQLTYIYIELKFIAISKKIPKFIIFLS